VDFSNIRLSVSVNLVVLVMRKCKLMDNALSEHCFPSCVSRVAHPACSVLDTFINFLSCAEGDAIFVDPSYACGCCCSYNDSCGDWDPCGCTAYNGDSCCCS